MNKHPSNLTVNNNESVEFKHDDLKQVETTITTVPYYINSQVVNQMV